MTLTTVNPALLDTQAQYTGFKNRIINPGMVIDQRNAGAAVANANGYMVDRFNSNYFGGATGRWTAQQITDAPSGFTKSFRVTVTTVDAAPSADYAYLYTRQTVEGNNIADLAWGTASAAAITVSFWVKASVTGSFPCVIYNGASTRAYGALYTISSANTWEYKTFTVPGDTTGVWSTDNSAGIVIAFGAGGSSREVSAGVWSARASTTPTTVSGAVNLLATSGATWQVTGVQLEKGSTATSFDYRPYGTELALCQRYYYKHADGSIANNQIVSIGFYESNSVIWGSVKFPVTMRAIPTNVSASGTNYYSLFGVMNDQFNSMSNALSSVNQAGFFNSSEASGTAGQTGSIRLNSSSAFVAFSAEL